MTTPKSDPVRTGAYIAELRKARDMTQLALATAMQVSHQAVSKWETGTALPDIDTLLAMAAFFEIRVDDLLAGGAAAQDTDEGSAANEEQRQYSQTMASLIKTRRDLPLLMEACEEMHEADIADCIQTLRITDEATLSPLFARLSSAFLAQVLKSLKSEALLPLAAPRMDHGDLRDVLQTLGTSDPGLLRALLQGKESSKP